MIINQNLSQEGPMKYNSDSGRFERTRPETRSDGSPWFLNDDPVNHPISQAFEVGPTMEELDRVRDNVGSSSSANH